MAAAVQVDVDDDNATVADCVPTPTAMEVFGCSNDDDVTTEVVVVAFEVVIVNVGTVVLDMLNCRVGTSKTEIYSDCFGHCGCAFLNLYSYWFIDQTPQSSVAVESICPK